MGFSSHNLLGEHPRVDPGDAGLSLGWLWKHLSAPLEKLEEVDREEWYWASLLRLLPVKPRPGEVVKNGQMDANQA